MKALVCGRCRAANLIVSIVMTVLVWQGACYGWHDETHLAVAKAAGYRKWYNAAGADIAKIKAGSVESFNHYYNHAGNSPITPEMVLEQAERYNDATDRDGHLYGAIIASLRKYAETTKEGKYAEYHIAYMAHYIGDLSQPLHHIPYDDYNKTHHSANDGVVEGEVLANTQKIMKNVYHITLNDDAFEKELAREIARVATISNKLAVILRKENRDMTKEEAYRQLGHSVSLLKAVLKHLKK